MPSLTVTPCKLACGSDGSGGHTEEEDLVSHTLGCIDLQLLDGSLQVGPPIDTLVNETKVVVELPVSLIKRYSIEVNIRSRGRLRTWV